MKPLRARLRRSIAAMVLASCSIASIAQSARPTPFAEAMGKAVDGLAAETAQRLTTDLHRGLAVVIRTGTSLGAEAVAAELLRTRLLERGIAVEVACPAKCLEISLIEFLAEGASGSALVPGQILNAPTGAVPGLSGLTRVSSERERAARPTALLVTFSARDGNRFLARSHVVAILAAETR